MRTQEEIIKEILDEIRSQNFVSTHEATDAECMGLLVAHYFEWDGIAILKTAVEALTDANFHSESAVVGKLLKSVEED